MKFSIQSNECIYPGLSDSECQWDQSVLNQRRKSFCNKVEGYGDICNCQNPHPIQFTPQKVSFIFTMNSIHV